MTPTEKILLKRKVFDTCMRRQQSLIDDFKVRTKALLKNEGLGNEEEYDHDELSQKNQASVDAGALNEALSLANEEMSFLNQLNATEKKIQTVVGPGAIVITNKTFFFISVSIEHFDVDGLNFFGISTKSPLYLTMKGLPVGSLFSHNGMTYKITDIF
jgi:hypothetical protein